MYIQWSNFQDFSGWSSVHRAGEWRSLQLTERIKLSNIEVERNHGIIERPVFESRSCRDSIGVESVHHSRMLALPKGVHLVEEDRELRALVLQNEIEAIRSSAAAGAVHCRTTTISVRA